MWSRFSPPVLLQRQEEGAGQESQGDVMVPTAPGAHLVFVQTRLALGGLKLRLDDPAGRGHLGQGQHGRLGWGVREVEPGLAPVQVCVDDLIVPVKR